MSFKSRIKHIISFLLHGETPIIAANVATYAPNNMLEGRCAIITGGTSGIGFCIAKAFLNAGATVIITGRSEHKLEIASSKLGNKERVFTFVMDSMKVESFELIFDKMKKTTSASGIGAIDILVNNAGVLGASIPNATEDQYDAVLDTNLKGVFFLSQLFANYMVANKIKGNILNVASSSSLRPALSAYTISKWGIRGFTMGLARSLAPHGITVNGIAPGQTATPMLNKQDDNLYNKTCPLGRWILPEEIANGAVFLVSDMGRAILGDIMYMTGGAALLSYEDMNYNVF